MSLNWREIDLILEELELTDSHIQKIHQPDFQSLVFQIYSPHKRFPLLIHLGQGQTRLHSVRSRPDKKVKLQRFAQFLRSRIAGGRITEARQIPAQRIVKLAVLRGGEATLLWIRLWGNASNIIATDSGGTILDAFYRRPNRGEVSGGRYDPEEEFKDRVITEKDKEYGLREHTIPSFNKFIEEEYGSKKEAERLEKLRAESLSELENHAGQLRRQLGELDRKRKEFEAGEKYKEIGDLITSNLHAMETGERWLKTENYYRNNETVEIELDPSLSPSDNAEKYFQKYRKAKSGLIHVSKELKNTERELGETEQIKEEVLNSSDLAFMEKVHREYAGKRKRPVRKAGDAPPGLRFRSGGFTILVGRNAKENDALLRHHVQGNDYWLHSRDYPGGYVFIKAVKGKSVPLETLLDAGNLALYFSKEKNSGSGEMYYTQVKYLRRAKHGKLGTVIPTQEKNLSITLDSARLKGLLNQESEDIV